MSYHPVNDVVTSGANPNAANSPDSAKPKGMEISFGWSESEGLHVYGTGNSNNIGGVTARLRGVF